MAMIHSVFALTNWVPISCPPEIRRWVKIRNAAVVNGDLYHVPVGTEMPEIGAVCAVADTLKEATALVAERAEMVKGHALEISVEALDEAEEVLARATELGIAFE
jgi:hypothetical protein